MKKMIVCFAAVLMILLVIAVCLGIWFYNLEWDRNLYEHWISFDSGMKVGVAEHKLDGGVCDVCGSEIVDFGDSIYVYNSNEHGDEVRYSIYEDGKLILDGVREYEYDKAGNQKVVKFYKNGLLSMIEEYMLNSNGMNVIFQSTNYYEDGSTVEEYDAYENPVIIYFYDIEGKLTKELHHEYETDELGNFYLFRTTALTPDDECKTVTTYNVHGDVIGNCSYNSEGIIEELIYKPLYDDEGRKIYECVYDGDCLLEENYFGVVETSDGWYTHTLKWIGYETDGTKIIREYDENQLIRETVYDPEGNVIE